MKEEMSMVTGMTTGGGYESSYLENDYLTEGMKDSESLTKNKVSVIVLVYQDQFDQKYLDAQTLAALTGKTRFSDYKYADGSVMSVSDTILLKKANSIPAGYESVTRETPDFSDQYPYNSELGLYELTDQQIAELIERYKSAHPDVDVQTEIRNVELKNINEMNNDKDYSELSAMLNEEKKSKEMLFKEELDINKISK